MNYSLAKKKEDPIYLTIDAREQLNKYQHNSLLIYTDGSVIDTGYAGAGFVIPDFKMSRSFHLGYGYSVYTAELLAILMALSEISNMKGNYTNITFCVDSKSVLTSLDSSKCKERSEMIYEILHNVNNLIINGTNINFIWVPSHCQFRYNDMADIAAKNGAKNINALQMNMPLSKNEMYTIVDRIFKHDLINTNAKIPIKTSRKIGSIARKIKLNALKTKYCASVTCLCSEKLTPNHVINECQKFRNVIPDRLKKKINELNMIECVDLAQILYDSEIGEYL